MATVLCQMIAFRNSQAHSHGMKLLIKPHLERLGMTQTQLADAMQVNRSFVSDIINGKKNPSLEKLELMIRALDASPSEVIIDADFSDIPIQPPADFSEGAAQAYTFSNAHLAQEIMRHVAPGARHPSPFRVMRNEPGFALLVGDIVIVDLNKPAKDNDIVLVTRVVDAGSAVTEFRRLITPWLVGGDATTPSERVDDATLQIAIIGTLAGVLRGAGL